MNKVLRSFATTFGLISLCVFFLSVPAQAQDFDFGDTNPTDSVKKNKNVISSVQGVITKFSPTGKHIDTTYIYRPKPQWIVRLNGNIQQTGVVFNSSLYADYLEAGSSTPETLGAKMKINMEEKVHYQMGVTLGWGGLSAGWNFEVGRKSAEKNTSMYVAFKRTFYGAQVHYYNIKQKPNGVGSLVLDSEETGHIETDDYPFESDYLAHLKEVVADAYYAFNRKHFAYTAVYSGNVVQRRSAGSWMLGGKYLWGKTTFDGEDDVTQMGYQKITAFTVQQGSLGGGYSYNIVALHRQPTGEHEKGLRNLTFNITAMPMLTFINSITTHRRIYDRDDEGNILLDQYTDNKEHSWGKVHLNYVANVGAIFSFNRFFIRLEARYNYFKYRHDDQHETITLKNGDVMNVNNSSHGHFYDWGIMMKFNVRL